MSLVKTPADDSKTAAAEDHAVADATKSSRPTAKDAALLALKMLRFLPLSLPSVLLLPMLMFPPSMK